MVNGLACTTDTASSSLARLDGLGCEDNCVNSTDPLLFTCELSNVILLRVVFPNGYREPIAYEDTIHTVELPVGFSAVSLNISEKAIDEYKRNFSLTLSIANVSLLNGGEIVCDDTTSLNNVTAVCRLCGKF